MGAAQTRCRRTVSRGTHKACCATTLMGALRPCSRTGTLLSRTLPVAMMDTVGGYDGIRWAEQAKRGWDCDGMHVRDASTTSLQHDEIAAESVRSRRRNASLWVVWVGLRPPAHDKVGARL